MRESVSGKYGGVGMIISGIQDVSKAKLEKLKSIPKSSLPTPSDMNKNKQTPTDYDNFPDTNDSKAKDEANDIKISKLQSRGIVVVDAFENYAFENNIRVGDRILSVDGTDTSDMSVDNVRNLLRGDPGTDISIVLEREVYPGTDTAPLSTSAIATATSSLAINTPAGMCLNMLHYLLLSKLIINAITCTVLYGLTYQAPGKALVSVTMKRQEIKMSDVSVATYLGSPQDGVGYIALSGFNADAAKDFASAMLMLKYTAPFGLKGLIVDLRGGCVALSCCHIVCHM